MPYIKIFSTKTRHKTPKVDDFIIVSQVVKSGMGFEYPVLVRDEKELTLWFGEDFEDKKSLVELLEMGVTLFLVSPYPSDFNTKDPNYVDYYNWPIDPTEYFSVHNLPNVGESGKIYKVKEEDGEIVSSTGVSFGKYVWFEGGYVRTSLLPQNMGQVSKEYLSKRPTLSILDSGNYFYPRYEREVVELVDYSEISVTEEDIKKVDSGRNTFCFDMNFPVTQVDGYFLLPYQDSRVLIHFGEEPTGNKKVHPRYYKRKFKAVGLSWEDKISSAIEEIKNTGEYLVYKESDFRYKVFRKTIAAVEDFYEMRGLSIVSDLRLCHDIFQVKFENKAKISFFSKTVGNSDNSEIDIQIENTGDKKYRVIISKLGIKETFEGYFGNNRLEGHISKNSKIVYCRVMDPEAISEGSWRMEKVEPLICTKDSYFNSLKELIGEEIEVKSDFILIPEPELIGYDYKTLLSLLKESGCQALIQNNEINLEQNLKTDKDNYLIYFYDKISYNREECPSYFIFLKGALNKNYYANTKSIVCDRAFLYDAYSEHSDFVKFKKNKSNYLSLNGHSYYFKELQNGESPNTTIWLRFVIEKVRRELEKHKWDLLSKDITREIRETLSEILLRIQNSFTMINSISISKFFVNYTSGKIGITLQTRLSDFINKDVFLDIVLNHNKQ